MSDSEAFTRLARDLIAANASTDEVLRALRDAGAWQIDTIRAIREVTGLTLGAAKTLVDESQVWADQRPATDHARRVAQRAAEEIGRGK